MRETEASEANSAPNAWSVRPDRRNHDVNTAAATSRMPRPAMFFDKVELGESNCRLRDFVGPGQRASRLFSAGFRVTGVIANVRENRTFRVLSRRTAS